MPRERRFYYWDTSVFLSYLARTPGRIEHIQAFLDEVGRSRTDRVVTSVISQTEVAYVTYDDGFSLDQATVDAIDALWANRFIFELIEVHSFIAVEARRLLLEAKAQRIGGLKPLDAIHLASALWVGVCEIHTYDQRWITKFTPLANCPICEPTADQPPLPGIS